MPHVTSPRSRRARAIAWFCAVAAVAGTWSPAYCAELFKEGAFANYRADFRRGETLFNAAGCGACHGSVPDPGMLSGNLRMDSFFGTFFSPNITSDAAGIGSWTDAQFLNAVMNGIRPDGRNLYPVMPYVAYAGLNPTDVLDIKAYIATLPKSDRQADSDRISLPYRLGATISLWKRWNLTAPAYQPGALTQLDRGRYLVDNLGACGECHTPRSRFFSKDDAHRFSGAKDMTGVYAPDISAARIAAVGERQFERALFSKGTKLDGSPLTDETMRRIALGLGKLGEDDRLAIVAYLKGAEVSATKLEATSAAACASAAANTAASRAAVGNADLASAADHFMGSYCRSCHGPGESDQGSYPAGDLRSIASDAHFVSPGSSSGSLLFSVVKSGRMPKSGGRPSAEEIKQLADWIDSLKQAPSSPSAAASPPRARKIISTSAVAEQALHDARGLDEADRRFIRYFSFVPQYNGTLPCEDDETFDRRLALYEAGFNKLLNSVSLGSSLVKARQIADARNLLVRIDIRDLGWTAEKWDRLTNSYPYAIDPQSDSMLSSLASSSRTSVPILRADWFMANASRPELYYPLLDLSDNIRDVERRLGVDASDDIRQLRVIRAGFLEGSSGVSDHNRMIERHTLPHGGYYWKSYDFSSSSDEQSLSQHPHGPAELSPLPLRLSPFRHAGGEMIFTLPNGMQGYYLSKATGDRLDEGPTSIVSFRLRPIGKGITVVNARSCFDCHADGIIEKRDQMRDVLRSSTLFGSEQEELLLRLYVEQLPLQQAYAADRNAFLNALDQIGATRKAPDGSKRSEVGPNNEEIITYFADLYESTMDEDAIAAEFDMTVEQFEAAVQRLEGAAFRVAFDWVNQSKGGSRIARSEIEAAFPLLAGPLLRSAPLERHRTNAGGVSPVPPAPVPQYKADNASAPDAAPGRQNASGDLTLAVKIERTNVEVGQHLSFDVVASKPCELQILYLNAAGTVKEFPSQMIGEPYLAGSAARHIPAQGAIVFSKPGSDETLLLACREGGLRDLRITPEKAKEIASRSHLAFGRDIEFQLSRDPSVATQAINFNVKAR